jgi:hypothetical protein
MRMCAENLRDFVEGSGGVQDLDDFYVSIGKMIRGGARVVAVMPFASKNENARIGLSETKRVFGDENTDTLYDLLLGNASGPGALFPGAHLLHSKDRQRHGRDALQEQPRCQLRQKRFWRT